MDGNDYIRIWTNALTAFGWPVDRIQHFVSLWSDDLNNEESLFYHEDPAYYLTWELLSERAVEEIGARLSGKSKGYPWELFSPVQAIINRHMEYYERMAINQQHKVPDWSAIKQDISIFLERHGEAMRCVAPA